MVTIVDEFGYRLTRNAAFLKLDRRSADVVREEFEVSGFDDNVVERAVKIWSYDMEIFNKFETEKDILRLQALENNLLLIESCNRILIYNYKTGRIFNDTLLNGNHETLLRFTFQTPDKVFLALVSYGEIYFYNLNGCYKYYETELPKGHKLRNDNIKNLKYQKLRGYGIKSLNDGKFVCYYTERRSISVF